MASPIEFFSGSDKPFFSLFIPNALAIHCLTPYACGVINPPDWSISNEAFFYLMFPLLGFFFAPKLRWKSFLMVTLTYAGYLYWVTHSFPDSHYAKATFPPNRVGEFAMGMLAGYLYSRFQPSQTLQVWRQSAWAKPAVIGLIGLWVALLLLWPVIYPVFPWLHDAFYVYYIVPGVLLISTLALGERLGVTLGAFTHPWIVFGGEISYSFYLVHQIVIRYFRHGLYYGLHVDPHTFSAWTMGFVALGLLVIALGLSMLMFLGVEKPCRKHIRTFFKA